MQNENKEFSILTKLLSIRIEMEVNEFYGYCKHENYIEIIAHFFKNCHAMGANMPVKFFSTKS